MKILLVYPNRNRFMAPPPIGLATLCPPLAQAGHEARILDLMFVRSPLATLRKAIGAFQPDVTGFSIRNLDEQDMSRPSTTLHDISPLVGEAKAAGQCVLLGGPAFSTFPERLLEYFNADLGIRGQAEGSLPRFLHTLGDAPDTTLPGLVWRQGGQVHANPPALPGYVGVRPDWGSYDHRHYRWSMFQSAVVVRSGCPFRCSYCDVPHVFGGRFIRRDTASIVADIRELRGRHGIRVVFLNDPAFNAPLDEAKQLLRELAAADLGVYLSSTFVPVSGQYDDEFWRLYRQAGGLFAVFGIEGLSETMLRRYAKPFTLDDVFRSCEGARRHGVRVICTTMLGGPGETDATIDEAAGTIRDLPWSVLTPGFGVRVLPHTPLFEEARQAGVVQDSDDLLFPRFFLSPDIDLPRARARIRGAIRSRAYRVLHMLPAGMRLMLARTLGVVS